MKLGRVVLSVKHRGSVLRVRAQQCVGDQRVVGPKGMDHAVV